MQMRCHGAGCTDSFGFCATAHWAKRRRRPSGRRPHPQYCV